MLLKIYPDNPNAKAVAQVVSCLQGGGVVIYPTDSVYAFGCALDQPKAIERMRAIAGKSQSPFSIVCRDLSEVARYARVDDDTFKLLRRNLPGAFTFILKASGKISGRYLEKKKSVGVRIPDHPIVSTLVEALGMPLVTTSVKGEEQEYRTDPSLIEELYGDRVDLVIDGGYGSEVATAVVDCTGDEVEVVREGAVELEW